MKTCSSAISLIVALALALSIAVQESESASLLRAITTLTEVERNEVFAGIVDSTKDHSCRTVTHSLIRGVDSEENVYVTVRCGDGVDYQLQLNQARSGVMPCSVLELVAQTDCWKPLP